MGFLYGDSAPFARDYDVLATVSALCRCLAETGPLFAETLALEGCIEEEVSFARDRLDARVDYLGRVLERVEDEAAPFGDVVDGQIRAVMTAVAQLIDRSRDDFSQAGASAEDRFGPEIRRLHLEIWRIVGGFLSAAGLPVESSTLRQRLLAANNDLWADVLHPDGLRVELELKGAGSCFNETCSLGDLAPGIRIQLGTRKGFLGRERAVHELLDRYLVVGMELDDESLELRVRAPELEDEPMILRIEPRALPPSETAAITTADESHPASTSSELGLGGGADEPEPTKASLHRDPVDLRNKRLVAEVERLEDGERTRLRIANEDMPAIRRLWQRLIQTKQELLAEPRRVLRIELNGNVLPIEGCLPPILAHFADTVLPLLPEIDARSPSADELSLKFDSEDAHGGRGARQEVYLRKDELSHAFEMLPRALRALISEDIIAIAPPRRSSLPPASDGAEADLATRASATTAGPAEGAASQSPSTETGAESPAPASVDDSDHGLMLQSDARRGDAGSLDLGRVGTPRPNREDTPSSVHA